MSGGRAEPVLRGGGTAPQTSAAPDCDYRRFGTFQLFCGDLEDTDSLNRKRSWQVEKRYTTKVVVASVVVATGLEIVTGKSGQELYLIGMGAWSTKWFVSTTLVVVFG